MMRFLAFLGALLLGLAAAQAAPIDNKDGFWSEWSDATFERAAAEKKFVIVSLQSWWCPWCHAMNRDTWANPEVRAVLKDHFIPVAVDQDSRPDISQRYERWGWPATIIFGPDGAEIVKLRGFYSPKFFIPILQETIRDPSPVDYGKFGGPERERTLATGLSDSERAEILAFIDKAYDRANGGWSKSKLVDGPTLGWFLDRAKAGDKEAEARIRRSLTAQLALIDKESGGISQVSLKPDWSQPSLEFPMFAQQAALSAYARAAVLFDDPTYRAAADRIFGFLKNTLAGPGGGFYASMGMAEGQPGVDRRQYARETGQAIQGLLAYYDSTGEKSALALAVTAADWATARAQPAGRRLPPRRARRGRALPRRQCRDGRSPAGAASLDRRAQMARRRQRDRRFHRQDLHRPQDRRLPRLGRARRQASAQADQAARRQCDRDALLHPARGLYRQRARSRDRRGRHGLSRLAAGARCLWLPARRAAGRGGTEERAGARDDRRAEGRSAQRRALCRRARAIPWPTSAPNGGTSARASSSTTTSTIPISPTAPQPSPARATSARCR